ncbi:Serrate RNA effector molecule [Quillaja saponaria]|uniref:Serrate RNA effector molecule n=1 Tax=Quillaja saponaria TaxID=32244 RepID=A0AAD7PBF8_QUISA|nr:Serrate RNA effector molecule [Quillaja saponaria]
MAETEVIEMPPDSLGKSPSASAATAATTSAAPISEDDPAPQPPPPSQPQSSQPPHSSYRRRDRFSRDRRDDMDYDRHPNRRGGDYYDRNMSHPPPLRERDRDYKRRRIPSPPHRDRRYSPPRRSPPPFKRHRRGSPRSGYGHDERFGYDYAGYERRMGGKPGYTDENSYGRFVHHSAGCYQNGLSDLESNRGYANSINNGGMQREGLMLYKQFIQELEDDVLPAEAERRYQEYKSEYISTQKRVYFNAHKDEEWLKDKYHPTNLVAVINRRNENARQLAKEFFLDLQNGTLNLNPASNSSSSSKLGQASDPNSDDEADTSKRRHGRGPVKENDFSAAPKAHPISSEPKRVQADIEQAQALIRKLDMEKGVEDNVLCGTDQNKNDNDKAHGGSVGPIIIMQGLTSVKGLEGVELLDAFATYLWRIHGVDYYGMIETNEAEGFRHMRPEGNGNEETSKSGSDWEKRLDSFWQGRLSGQDPLEIMTAREKIDAAAVEALDPHVRKIRDEKYGWKYGCGAKGCTKLFHATEFVHKHLKLKHQDLLMELTSKVREDLYFQNYMNDPDAPGGTPVMQQPQKDKPLKHRPTLENRLRDERSNRRDHEWIDRVNDRERFDTSPSHDRQSKSGALEAGNLDESMYDAYAAGQPFTPDMPPLPPVLMPVPGAGPLGPFVPAPPEVAMQMLRDQGEPSSSDGPGRNTPSGSHVGGPSPIITVPPSFRPDPRKMRSYQDLDALEDEVTVIDYRSL